MAVRYQWDDFVLDLENYRLERNGTPVALEPKALNVLVFLVQRPARLVTKQELFDAVWPDTAVTDHALTRIIAQLRRALGDEAREASYIETVPTRGYRWIRPLDTPSRPSAPATSDELSTPGALSAPDALDAASAPAPTNARSKRTRVFGIAALTLVAATVALLTWLPRATTTIATNVGVPVRHDFRWPVQITTGDGLDLQPAISPSSDAIAYVSDRTGALEIYIRALDGTAVDTALTNDGAQNVQPAWSPDGRYIAYHSYKNGGVWIVPARGGVPRQLAPQGSNPAWAPDGSRLAFQSDEHADVTPSAWGAQTGSTLWLVDTDGTNLTQLTTSSNPMGGHAAPAWSRDGRHLAFAVFEGGLENGIWLLTLDTGKIHSLARGPGLYELAFAPDNTAIYVAGGEAFVMRVPFDADTGTTGQPQMIPIAGVPGVRGLSVSSDGQTLAFAGLALSSQIWAQPVRGDGTRAREAYALTRDTSRRNSLATMSPDGTKIAYMSTRGGRPPDVWLMNADGTGQMALTSDESIDGKPTWLPDGRRVVYSSNRNQSLGLWTVDVITRRHERFFDYERLREQGETAPLTGRLAELDLAPSLSRIAFTLVAPPSGHRRLYTATLTPFAARALTDGRESVGYPAWSPDERSLAVEIKVGSSTHAGIVDVETGTLRQLTSERGQTWVRSWSPDSRKIAMAVLREGTWRLEWIDVQNARRETITPALPPRMYVRYPEWAPRGDVILFERGELRGNIWTLRVR